MIYCFPPIVNSNTKTLILGTMPGVASLQKQEYYANPRNHFWKIMYTLFDGLPVSTMYTEKKQVLLSNGIGLWDVLENCDREGSLDTQIKNQKVNDFETVFKKFPAITTILFNGKESHRYFLKKFGLLNGITYRVIPSTSPANTMSFEKKLIIWASCFPNNTINTVP